MGSYIEIDSGAWASMKEHDPEEMIYMINLLKFRDTVKEGLGIDGRKGRDAWMNKYGAGVNAVAERLDTSVAPYASFLASCQATTEKVMGWTRGDAKPDSTSSAHSSLRSGKVDMLDPR